MGEKKQGKCPLSSTFLVEMSWTHRPSYSKAKTQNIPISVCYYSWLHSAVTIS